MNRSSFLMSLVLTASITTATIQAGWDEVAAFAIPAILTDYCMSKRTVDDARAQAQAMIYYYENHLAVYTIEDIHNAYWVMRATDQQIENKLWWNYKARAFVVGICTAAVYSLFKYPQKHTISWHFSIPLSSLRYAMPFYG